VSVLSDISTRVPAHLAGRLRHNTGVLATRCVGKMQLRSSAPSHRGARGVLCASIALSFGATMAQQKPKDVYGTATVTTVGSTTTVATTNGPRGHSAFDWPSFQVPVGTTVDFVQPSVQSLSINRVVTGGGSSVINGLLKSNGRLVLVNPAGIAFGAGAQVDTASFTASTLGMTAADMILGRLRFDLANNGDDEKDKDKDKDKDKNKGSAGTLRVDSTSVLAKNGDVVLIGPNIEIGRGAVVEAVGGDVILAAGRRVELTGRGLEGIRMEVRAPDDKAVNLGTLKGDSVAIFAGQLQHSGLIQAKTVTTSGGKVILQGLKEAEIEGRIEAANALRGGSVLITAEKLELKKATFIDVRHGAGGGEILIGGGRRGADPRLLNAAEVKVEQGVQLKADATLAGLGGTVVLWSERKTEFAGQITARGAGAPGGYVEVNSRRELKFKKEGKVDVSSAPAGSSSQSGASGGSSETRQQPRRPGKSFPEGTVIALIPTSQQPVEVQEAIAAPDRETAGKLNEMAWLPTLASKPEDPYDRKVVVTAVQCTVTR
jgi:filamentous hemagglutinin family protein